MAAPIDLRTEIATTRGEKKITGLDMVKALYGALNLDEEDYAKIQVDKIDTLFTMSTAHHAKTTALLLKSFVDVAVAKTSKTVVDGTGCLGGDTLELGNVFNEVVAYEVNAHRATLLKNNMDFLNEKKLLGHNITVVHASLVDKAGDEGVEVSKETSEEKYIYWKDVAAVMIDAPWGGRNYRDQALIDELYLQDPDAAEAAENNEKLALITVVRKLHGNGVPAFALKVPTKYNFQRLVEAFKGSAKAIRRYDYRKYAIVILVFSGTGAPTAEYTKLKGIAKGVIVNHHDYLPAAGAAAAAKEEVEEDMFGGVDPEDLKRVDAELAAADPAVAKKKAEEEAAKAAAIEKAEEKVKEELIKAYSAVRLEGKKTFRDATAVQQMVKLVTRRPAANPVLAVRVKANADLTGFAEKDYAGENRPLFFLRAHRFYKTILVFLGFEGAQRPTRAKLKKIHDKRATPDPNGEKGMDVLEAMEQEMHAAREKKHWSTVKGARDALVNVYGATLVNTTLDNLHTDAAIDALVKRLDKDHSVVAAKVHHGFNSKKVVAALQKINNHPIVFLRKHPLVSGVLLVAGFGSAQPPPDSALAEVYEQYRDTLHGRRFRGIDVLAHAGQPASMTLLQDLYGALKLRAEDYEAIEYDAIETLYTMSRAKDANKTAELLKNRIGVNAIVVDGTGCLGGDTRALGNVFRDVIAFETNPTRARMLNDNMGFFNEKKMLKNAVTVVEGSIVDAARDSKIEHGTVGFVSWNNVAAVMLDAPPGDDVLYLEDPSRAPKRNKHTALVAVIKSLRAHGVRTFALKLHTQANVDNVLTAFPDAAKETHAYDDYTLVILILPRAAAAEAYAKKAAAASTANTNGENAAAAAASTAKADAKKAAAAFAKKNAKRLGEAEEMLLEAYKATLVDIVPTLDNIKAWVSTVSANRKTLAIKVGIDFNTKQLAKSLQNERSALEFLRAHTLVSDILVFFGFEGATLPSTNALRGLYAQFNVRGKTNLFSGPVTGVDLLTVDAASEEPRREPRREPRIPREETARFMEASLITDSDAAKIMHNVLRTPGGREEIYKAVTTNNANRKAHYAALKQIRATWKTLQKRAKRKVGEKIQLWESAKTPTARLALLAAGKIDVLKRQMRASMRRDLPFKFRLFQSILYGDKTLIKILFNDGGTDYTQEHVDYLGAALFTRN